MSQVIDIQKTTETVLYGFLGPVSIKRTFKQLGMWSIHVEGNLQNVLIEVADKLYKIFRELTNVLYAYEELKQMVHKGSFITYVIIDGRTATFHKMLQEDERQMMIHYDATCGKFDLHYYGHWIH